MIRIRFQDLTQGKRAELLKYMGVDVYAELNGLTTDLHESCKLNIIADKYLGDPNPVVFTLVQKAIA